MDKEQDLPTDTIPESPPADDKPAVDTPSRKRLGIPSWTLGLLILALTGVLIWAGDAWLRSRRRLPDPVPEDVARIELTETPKPIGPSPTSPPVANTPAPTATVIPLPSVPIAADPVVVLVAEFE